MTTEPRTGQETTVNIISRDRNGKITDHLRIHPDGREEKMEI